MMGVGETNCRAFFFVTAAMTTPSPHLALSPLTGLRSSGVPLFDYGADEGGLECGLDIAHRS
jgi:hypothetical protein